MTGPDQERWLLIGLARSRVRWNVIAQAQLMAELRQRTPGGADAYWTDGYSAARARILTHLSTRRVANPVVIGGDIHSFWVTDLKTDFRDPGSPSWPQSSWHVYHLTGGALRVLRRPAARQHVRFFESRLRGYVQREITPTAGAPSCASWTTCGIRARARTLATFLVENGRPRAIRG